MARGQVVPPRRRSAVRRCALLGVVVMTTGYGVLSGATATASAPPVRELSILAGTGTAGPSTPGPAAESDLDGAFGSAVDGLGDVFIADSLNNEVDEVSTSGTLRVIAGTGTAGPPTPGPATQSELDQPSGVAVDGLGDVFIADQGNYDIDEVTPSGTLSVIAGTGKFGAPTPGPAASSAIGTAFGLAVDRLGNLYIPDGDNEVVEKVSASGTLSIFAGTGKSGPPTAGPAIASELNFPAGVAVDGLGDVYIADTFGNRVVKVTAAGTLSVFAGTGSNGLPTPGPAKSSELNHPYGVGVDTSGDVYIADTFNSDVEEVTPTGSLSLLAGTGTSGAPTPGPASASKLGEPVTVAANGLGVLSLADFQDSEVDRITAPQGGTATVGVAAPASGGYLQVTASGQVSASGATLHGSPAGLTSPVAAIAATSSGGYFVATASGHIYNYDATFEGSPAGAGLTSPLVGLATTAKGYVAVTAAGTVYAYDTTAHGSPAGSDLHSPVVGIATTSAGGYDIATAAGAVYSYDATSHGSPQSNGVTLSSPVVGIATTSAGYLVVTASGHVYNYGAAFHGSPASSHVTLTDPITGITATSGGSYVLTTSSGTTYSYGS